MEVQMRFSVLMLLLAFIFIGISYSAPVDKIPIENTIINPVQAVIPQIQTKPPGQDYSFIDYTLSNNTATETKKLTIIRYRIRDATNI